MTNDLFYPYTPPSYNPGTSPDVFYANALSGQAPRRHARNSFRVLQTFPEFNAVYSELKIRDWSGGAHRFSGGFEDFPNTYAYAWGIDALNPGYFFPALTDVATARAASTPLAGLHSEYVFSTLFMGIGDATNLSLFKETSATNPVPVAVTYDPTGTSAIISLSKAVIGGGTVDERLIVGLSDEPAQIIGDANGTVDATMHVNTEPLWWLVQTSLPAAAGGFSIIMQNGTSISALATTSATSDAPVAVTTNVHGGGFLIKPGEFSLGGGPRRIWFVMPKEHTPAGMLTITTEVLGYVYSCNLEGGDLQKLEFNEMPNGVTQAVFVRGGILASDGQRAIHHTGGNEENLRLSEEVYEAFGELGVVATIPAFATTSRVHCRGFAIQTDDAWAAVDVVSSGQFTSSLLWKYDWDNRGWQHYSTDSTGGGTASICTVLAAGSQPMSPNTHAAHRYHQTVLGFYSNILPITGENMYFNRNQTAVTKAFYNAQAAFLWSTRWTLPGLEGFPSVIESIRMTGIATSLNSGVTIDVLRNSAIATYSLSGIQATATFLDNTPIERPYAHYKRFLDNTDTFEELLYRLRLNSASATVVPLINSITFRMFTFLDGVPKTPRTVLGL